MVKNNYFQAFKGSIARIYHANGAVVGAGFLVLDRYLLTCAHVVAAALSIPGNTQEKPTDLIELDFPLIASGQKVKSRVVFWQPVNPSQSVEDIAGLKLEGDLPIGIQPCIYLIATEDYWQHPIRIFGFPQGHDLGIWATGTLRDRRANNWVQIDALAAQDRAVEKGFSGAPIAFLR
jgi:Trypsin-like peptidase domain